MLKSDERADKRKTLEPPKAIYTPPLLTRCGTVEELTTDAVSTGSGIPTDFSQTG